MMILHVWMILEVWKRMSEDKANINVFSFFEPTMNILIVKSNLVIGHI